MQPISHTQTVQDADRGLKDKRSLSIAEYNRLEEEAVERFSPYITRHFLSKSFYDFASQTRINNPRELWKFVDSEYDTECKETIVTFLSKRLTQKEYDVFTSLAQKTVNYCKQYGFDPVSGRNALSRALIAIRAIVQLVQPGATIFEFGLGSGYVTAGLVMLGYKVIACETTQSLFLHQNSFFHFLFGARYSCCLDTRGPIDLTTHDLCHVPWWSFVDTHYSLPPIDVLTINHIVNATPPLSVQFLLCRLQEANRDKSYKLIIEGLGPSMNKNYSEIIRPHFELQHYNEAMLFNDYVPVIVLESLGRGRTTSKENKPSLRLRTKIFNYIRQQLNDKRWPWLSLYHFYLSYPRLRRLIKKIAKAVTRIVHESLEPVPQSRSSAILLEKLKHSSVPFSYTYADIEDFFDDVLPEGKNLTACEKFAQFIKTH